MTEMSSIFRVDFSDPVYIRLHTIVKAESAEEAANIVRQRNPSVTVFSAEPHRSAFDLCIDCSGHGLYPSGSTCISCAGTGLVLSGDGMKPGGA